MILNQGNFDGNNFFSVYGIIVTLGLRSTDGIVSMKEGLVQSWPEFNGSEYFLTNKKEDYTVSWACVLIASNEADYTTKKGALDALLGNGLVKNVFLTMLNKTFVVKFNKASALTVLEKSNTRIAVAFTLEFTVLVNPTNQSDQIVYTIIDGNGI